MATHKEFAGRGNIFDIFTGLIISSDPLHRRISRLSPEVDGISMLYSNRNSSDKFYSMKLICWALREDGSIDGVVPWFDGVRCCDSLYDAEIGQWEGYIAPGNDHVFFGPPAHKILELESAAQFFSKQPPSDSGTLQEFTDSIGTHALLIDSDCEALTLSEVVSWRLNAEGRIQAMLSNPDDVVATPILPGADCLYPADTDPYFRYFFPHKLANQIKAEEPEAMAAIAVLLQR